ncbi:unnamed protein product [Merluccius merluccius]
MGGPRVTDFSIDRLLSSDFPRPADPSAQKDPGYHRPPGYHPPPGGCCPPPGGYHPPPGGASLRRPPGELCYGDPCRACCCGLGPAAGRLFSYGRFRAVLDPTELTFHPAELTFHPAELTFHPADLTFYPRRVRDTGEPLPAVQVRSMQRSRVRTVFTGRQTEQLERLLRVTDRPAAEERAALAASSGLAEETVRNRRARRKRQRTGPKLASRPLKPRDTLPSRGSPLPSRGSPLPSRGSPPALKPRDTLLSAVL